MNIWTTTLILGCIALPSFSQDYSHTVKRGETIRIFSWSFFGDTCRVTAYPDIRAVRGGTLGTLSSGRGAIKINRVVESSQQHCVGKTVEGTLVNYTAGDKTGTDTVTLARKRLSGKDARYDIAITVK